MNEPQTIHIPGTNPRDYYELRCDAFKIQGPSLTKVVAKWAQLKPNADQFASIEIKGIYHKWSGDGYLVNNQTIEQLPEGEIE